MLVILNTVKKKRLKQLAVQVLYRNNNPSDLQQNLDQYYIYNYNYQLNFKLKKTGL